MSKAGIAVAGPEQTVRREAVELNAGFLSRITKRRPLVTLKLATTLDGRIATAQGESQWITGAGARARGHMLRAQHDGILVGIETALADDPELTCRLPGLLDRSPVRIVLDSRLRLAADSRLARAAGTHPLWLITGPENGHAELENLGAVIMPAKPLNERDQPATVAPFICQVRRRTKKTTRPNEDGDAETISAIFHFLDSGLCMQSPCAKAAAWVG